MIPFSRRRFVQASAGAALSVAASPLLGESGKPSIAITAKSVKVHGATYSWEYQEAEDTFQLRDSQNRLIVSGKLQPAVVVAPFDGPSQRLCKAGRVIGHHVEDGRLQVDYDQVNGNALLSGAWRFDEHGIWMEPVIYDTLTREEIVSLNYFTDINGAEQRPNLNASYFVVPGLLGGPTISPVIQKYVHLDESVWLGRGSYLPGLNQQWGLPVHYFCGFSTDDSGGAKYSHSKRRSDSFACGLADLPNGDLFLNLYEGAVGIRVDYRSDLWKHVRGPGKLELGATLSWSIAPDYYQAVAAYYDGLLKAGVIRTHKNSPLKTSVALAPQFCTWGSQLDRHKANFLLDQAYLDNIYSELKSSGMKFDIFSIDDKWEGNYGKLEHSATRLPHFEQFLEQVRRDGHRIGIWAALMRCEDPATLGLTDDHMLKMPDGKSFKIQNDFNPEGYYIIDFTQPVAAKALADVARRFMRRYKPDLFKFDFGYELPAMSVAAPKDKGWSGERLMWKGLDIVIKAMREVNPDLVVMYYQLSPLFLDYFDIHSIDDLYMAAGEYEVEANRRMFFSSLLGPLGIPTYGSSGYDWKSMPEIWFDSAAVGTLGSMNDFEADEQGERGGPEYAAKYNGLSQVLRSTNTFKILPLDINLEAPTLGAHARSWARFEEGQLVLLAYRPPQPGQMDCLMSEAVDLRVKDSIRSAMPVVISSKSNQSIAEANSLGVVPYGHGEIVIRRKQGSQAAVVFHYFGDGMRQDQVAIRGGFLKLNVESSSLNGKPLEWIEVRIS